MQMELRFFPWNILCPPATSVPVYHWTSGLVYQCTTGLVYQCTSVPVYHWTSGLVDQCTVDDVICLIIVYI